MAAGLHEDYLTLLLPLPFLRKSFHLFTQIITQNEMFFCLRMILKKESEVLTMDSLTSLLSLRVSILEGAALPRITDSSPKLYPACNCAISSISPLDLSICLIAAPFTKM